MSADHTRLKGVVDIGDSLLSDQLETNLYSYCNWAFAGIGAFFNITVPSPGPWGGSMHQLRPASDPYYSGGQVWQGWRQDWVWETGVDAARQPIRVSGVYVDGDFYPTGGTGYPHTVNYPLGRVVFDSPVATTKSVTCEFSPRWVQFSTADVPWWREVQTSTMRIDHPHFALAGSGMWDILAQNRIQLPHVVIEAATDLGANSRRGLAIGGGDIVSVPVLFHLLAETPGDLRRLHDIFTYQFEKRLILFNSNWVGAASGWPLDEYGTPVSGARMYPDMVKSRDEGGYGWRQLRVVKTSSSPQPEAMTGPVYAATVRWTCETDLF